MTVFNYQNFFAHELSQFHREGRYRVFADLEWEAQSGIHAFNDRAGRSRGNWEGRGDWSVKFQRRAKSILQARDKAVEAAVRCVVVEACEVGIEAALRIGMKAFQDVSGKDVPCHKGSVPFFEKSPLNERLRQLKRDSTGENVAMADA